MEEDGGEEIENKDREGERGRKREKERNKDKSLVAADGRRKTSRTLCVT